MRMEKLGLWSHFSSISPPITVCGFLVRLFVNNPDVLYSRPSVSNKMTGVPPRDVYGGDCGEPKAAGVL